MVKGKKKKYTIEIKGPLERRESQNQKTHQPSLSPQKAPLMREALPCTERRPI